MSPRYRFASFQKKQFFYKIVTFFFLGSSEMNFLEDSESSCENILMSQTQPSPMTDLQPRPQKKQKRSRDETEDVPRNVPSNSAIYNPSELKKVNDAGFLMIFKLQPDDWKNYIFLGAMVRKETQTKNKNGEIQTHTSYEVPVYRTQESLVGTSDAGKDNVDLKMFIEECKPTFALKPKQFDVTKSRLGLNFTYSFNAHKNPNEAKLRLMLEGRDRFIKAQLKVHPGLKARKIEGCHYEPSVQTGKIKKVKNPVTGMWEEPKDPDPETVARYDSFCKFDVAWDKESKRLVYKIWYLKKETTDEKVLKFMASDESKGYPFNLCVHMKAIVAQKKQVIIRDNLFSISLPKPIESEVPPDCL